MSTRNNAPGRSSDRANSIALATSPERSALKKACSRSTARACFCAVSAVDTDVESCHSDMDASVPPVATQSPSLATASAHALSSCASTETP